MKVGIERTQSQPSVAKHPGMSFFFQREEILVNTNFTWTKVQQFQEQNINYQQHSSRIRQNACVYRVAKTDRMP